MVSSEGQIAPNPPEFAQPRLSGAKRHRSNTPKFVASHLGNTSHIGTNTPKFVPSCWGWPPFDLLKQGCANSGGFGARWRVVFCFQCGKSVGIFWRHNCGLGKLVPPIHDGCNGLAQDTGRSNDRPGAPKNVTKASPHAVHHRSATAIATDSMISRRT